MRCFCAVLYAVFCIAAAVQAEVSEPSAIATSLKRQERHFHILYRPDASGRLSLPLVHVTDSPFVSFAQIGAQQEATSGYSDSEYERGRSAGMAEGRQMAYDEAQRVAAHASMAEASTTAATTAQTLSYANAGPTTASDTTCKFPMTHVHFYMPHTGPVSPLMMMPFMHPSALWGAPTTTTLDITEKAETAPTAEPKKSESPIIGTLKQKIADAAHKLGWDTVGEVSGDALSMLEDDAEFMEAMAPMNSASEAGPTPPPADPCAAVPQMHLHIFDPASGHKAAAASVAAATYPISPLMGTGLPQFPFGMGYNPYNPCAYGMCGPRGYGYGSGYPLHPLHGF